MRHPSANLWLSRLCMLAVMCAVTVGSGTLPTAAKGHVAPKDADIPACPDTIQQDYIAITATGFDPPACRLDYDEYAVWKNTVTQPGGGANLDYDYSSTSITFTEIISPYKTYNLGEIWDSGLMYPGQIYTNYNWQLPQFPGVYTYMSKWGLLADSGQSMTGTIYWEPGPTATPTPSDSPTPTDTPTDSPTASDTATDTPTDTPTDTATDTGTATDTPTDTPTPTDTGTATDTFTPSDTATDTDTPTPTDTETDTDTPTDTFTVTPTSTPHRLPKPKLPDLSVTQLQVKPASLTVGGSLQVTSTIKNGGPGASGGSGTMFFLSKTTKRTGGTFIGNNFAPGLASQATYQHVQSLSTSGVPAGTYYLVACADGYFQVVESNENNNCKASNGQIVLTKPKPANLTVTQLVMKPTKITLGGSLVATSTVKNVGKGPAGASTTMFFLSPTGQRTDSDVVGTVGVPSLPAASTNQQTKTLDASAVPAGKYFLIACADVYNQVPETNEADNCKVTTGQLTISAPKPPAAAPRLARHAD